MSTRGGSRARAAVLSALLALGLSVCIITPAGAAEDATEGQFVSLANGSRSDRNVASMSVDNELTAIARRWSAKMAADNRLAHNPNLAREVTQDWQKLGENVGVGDNAPQIHDAFMNSPAHRDNIVDPEFTRVGMGVVRASDGRVWVTEVFMRLRGEGQPANSGDAATPPPSSSRPAPSPPTTKPRPAASASTTRPPVTTTAVPPTTEAATTTTSAVPLPPAAVRAAPALASVPALRLRLVLGQLAALDRGH